jgi:hypothetical protein
VLKGRLLRYTNLASAIHILQTNAVTLVSPSRWDDRNDIYSLERYRREKSLKTVLALCFMQSPEQYHHWRVFASGADGVAIRFDREKLVAAAESTDGVRAKSVRYLKTEDLKKTAKHLQTDDLPFLKRIAYTDENELRILYSSADESVESKSIKISPSFVERITLSPWMPRALFETTKETLRLIDGWKNVKVSRSKLIDYEHWKTGIDRV